MTLGGYDAFDDPYAYKGSSTLKNKLGLRDSKQLEAFELEMSTLRSEEPLPPGRLNPTHFRAVHKHLFQDVYSWAGQYRSVRTSKGGNPFCFPEHIAEQLDIQFVRLHAGPCFTGEKEEFLAAAADFLAEVNAIHAFREGNGRAQLAFMHLIGLAAGYPFDFSRVHPPSFLSAMITSYDRKLGPLILELRSLLIC